MGEGDDERTGTDEGESLPLSSSEAEDVSAVGNPNGDDGWKQEEEKREGKERQFLDLASPEEGVVGDEGRLGTKMEDTSESAVWSNRKRVGEACEFGLAECIRNAACFIREGSKSRRGHCRCKDGFQKSPDGSRLCVAIKEESGDSILGTEDAESKDEQASQDEDKTSTLPPGFGLVVCTEGDDLRHSGHLQARALLIKCVSVHGIQKAAFQCTKEAYGIVML
ncbi:hypothetical protein PoB_002837300 [Plakobranchus ocellatus]|uniref:EGF-like domain-containing protein n=1 Tax=Plakobranchus ocellatus TaxID=259542 RepID=A0AAV4A3V7_9GAST|nr:hypothetical protein PoB_002837300 [Plakobranchus ocellatus]